MFDILRQTSALRWYLFTRGRGICVMTDTLCMGY